METNSHPHPIPFTLYPTLYTNPIPNPNPNPNPNSTLTLTLTLTRSPDARRRSKHKEKSAGEKPAGGSSPRAAPRSPAAYNHVWSAARIVAGDTKGSKSIV